MESFMKAMWRMLRLFEKFLMLTLADILGAFYGLN